MRFLLALSAVASILASSQAFLAPMPSTITSGRAAATISRDINSLPVSTRPSTLQQAMVSTRSMSSKRAALMKREVIPQLLFVAACAGAIIGYVATHIDEIKYVTSSQLDHMCISRWTCALYIYTFRVFA
jgi:hypothetical protein